MQYQEKKRGEEGKRGNEKKKKIDKINCPYKKKSSKFRKITLKISRKAKSGICKIYTLKLLAATKLRLKN